MFGGFDEAGSGMAPAVALRELRELLGFRKDSVRRRTPLHWSHVE